MGGQLPFTFRKGEGEKPEKKEPFVFSVSGLQRKLKVHLDEHFARVYVGGEISNFSLHGVSGHAYFSLKDQDAQLRCVMWREQFERLRFPIKDGAEMIAFGKLTVFERSGQLQMTVLSLKPLGAGAQREAFERLKEKLRQEGLTAPERKNRSRNCLRASAS